LKETFRTDWTPTKPEPDPETGITISVEGTPLENPTVRCLGRGINYGASRFDGIAVTGHRIFIEISKNQ
jgi:hypothetical protein